MKLIDFLIENKEKISVNYYWYDHLTRVKHPEIIEEISSSIVNHDWEIFNKYFSQKDKTVTLPNTLSVYIEHEENFYAQIELNELTFNFITDSEYECG